MIDSLDEQYLRQLRKAGSISKAAAALGISQPALSMKLSQLEKRLGFTLFNRRVSPITLTPAGIVFFDYLDEQDALRTRCLRQISELNADGERRLSVGAPTVYVNSILIDACTALHREHPSYKIRIESASVPKLAEMARNAELDCFIATSLMPEEDFVNVIIRKERTHLCFAATHPIAQLLPDRPLTEQDLHLLDDQEMVFLKSNQPMQITLERIIQKYGLKPKPSFTVDQISTALALAENGAGICLATDESLKKLKDRSVLQSRSMEALIPDRPIYAAYTRYQYTPSACMELINHLHQQPLIKEE